MSLNSINPLHTGRSLPATPKTTAPKTNKKSLPSPQPQSQPHQANQPQWKAAPTPTAQSTHKTIQVGQHNLVPKPERSAPLPPTPFQTIHSTFNKLITDHWPRANALAIDPNSSDKDLTEHVYSTVDVLNMLRIEISNFDHTRQPLTGSDLMSLLEQVDKLISENCCSHNLATPLLACLTDTLIFYICCNRESQIKNGPQSKNDPAYPLLSLKVPVGIMPKISAIMVKCRPLIGCPSYYSLDNFKSVVNLRSPLYLPELLSKNRSISTQDEVQFSDQLDVSRRKINESLDALLFIKIFCAGILKQNINSLSRISLIGILKDYPADKKLDQSILKFAVHELILTYTLTLNSQVNQRSLIKNLLLECQPYLERNSQEERILYEFLISTRS